MGKVVHFEIPVDDIGRARKFYSSVFGWETEDVKGMPPGMEYVMLHTTETDKKTRMPKEVGAINGGMMKRMPAVKSPVVTIDVDDIDKAIENVTKSGGKLLMEKQKVMEMGWNAYVKDTEGNVIGVWQAIKKPNQ